MISGTSRDGVDAVLVSLKGDKPEILDSSCRPYPPAIADELGSLVFAGQRPVRSALESLDRALADHFSQTVQRLLEHANLLPADVAAIGSHGQTVWHEPDGINPVSIQLGDPGRIASRTGIVTVGDFRQADIDAGGQGAPLAPLLHRALFRPESGTRVVLNLGGIANISIINESGNVSGFDTGPANCLLDAWIRSARGEPFDDSGKWAAGGTVDTKWLKELLEDAYFSKPGPKSTGIEYFNLSWLEQYGIPGRLSQQDVQATLCELTAASVANAIRPVHPAEVLVCGGGVHNAHLVSRLSGRLPQTSFHSTANYGLDPDWVEAVLFAWLAQERLAGRFQDTRQITGASKPVMLGAIVKPQSVS
jgi:anhydro-N-acetylmuramic acid kinase